MSQQYASRTLSYNNFDFFRSNGTDLYLLIHSILGSGSIVQFKNNESSKQYIERLQRNIRSIDEVLNTLTQNSLPDLTRNLMRIERELKITDSTLKKVRRFLVDYDRLKQKGEKNTPHKRNKRFIMEIISIAIGTATTALSTSNTIQMNNLQKEIKTIQSSIHSLKNSINVYNNQMFQLTKGQIKIIEELHHTQVALNNTIGMINEHSRVLEYNQRASATMMSMITVLRKAVTSINQAVETHFIHESMEDIFANKLNLKFISSVRIP